MNTRDTWPLWCDIVERCWVIFWRVIGVAVVCATIPAALFVGCRAIGIITRVSP